MAPPSLTYRRTLATISTQSVSGYLTALNTAFSSANSRWRVISTQSNGVSGLLEAVEVAPPLTSPLANMRVLFAGSEDASLVPMMTEHTYEINKPMALVAAPNGGTISGAAPTLGAWSTVSGSGGPYGAGSRVTGFVKIAGSSSAWRELAVLTSDEDCAVWACTTTGSVWTMPWGGASGYAPGLDSESERVFSIGTSGTVVTVDGWASAYGQLTDWVSGNAAPKQFYLAPGGSAIRQAAINGVRRSGSLDTTEQGNRMYSRLGYIWYGGSSPYKQAFGIRGPVIGRGEWRQYIDTASIDYWVFSGNLEGEGSYDALMYPVMP